jgi:hypothetical protein
MELHVIIRLHVVNSTLHVLIDRVLSCFQEWN